jgi:hypothetical protein
VRHLGAALREIIGLFLDDEFLAFAILSVVGGAAVLTKIPAAAPLAAGIVLLVGCLAVLVIGVLRTARSHDWTAR